MAESEHREGRKSRRLPPISGGGDGNEPGEEKKPKRRRRPRSTDAVEDPGDEGKLFACLDLLSLS